MKNLRSIVVKLRTTFLYSLIASITAFAISAWYFIYIKISFLDDSFIYLHMAANIAELGTARYFPIANSEMLLASSPLKLITLIPGFIFLDLLNIPLRTLFAAKFAFVASGIIAYLIFLPFWKKNLKVYFSMGALYFLLSISLDTFFLMEGGLLFLSLASLIYLLGEENTSIISIGFAIGLVGLSRPEIGAIALVILIIRYRSNTKNLKRMLVGLLLLATPYSILMFLLGVYPIPSTIWSKYATGELELFTSDKLIDVFPNNFVQLMGLNEPKFFWVLILILLLSSLGLGRGFYLIALALVGLFLVANNMPGNYIWYSENFLIVLMVIFVVVIRELKIAGHQIMSRSLKGLTIGLGASIFISNVGVTDQYPWNVDTPLYSSYKEIGESSTGAGEYKIEYYSNQKVRVRMCEIGITSFYSGANSWIFDLCGLAQIGNLAGASDSWLQNLYPESFAETGEDQLIRMQKIEKLEVIDIWGLRNESEILSAKSNCFYADNKLCINIYSQLNPK